MLGAFSSPRKMAAQLAALDKSQAVIEFRLDGIIITANRKFLDSMGYSLPEIKGKHHSLFVDEATRNSDEYQAFWASLPRGEYHAAEFCRFAKGGKEIWIQASYNPIVLRSKPFKVVKYATVITDRVMKAADDQGQIAAINRSQAVIHFNLDGTILSANENFLDAVGYTSQEIVGRHHSMFVDPAEREGAEYRLSWDRLRRGE